MYSEIAEEIYRLNVPLNYKRLLFISSQAYQHLFYLLQTNPHYFAKLIFEMSPNKTNQFMENVILTVLNYAHDNREQYLLVRLFETALVEEIT